MILLLLLFVSIKMLVYAFCQHYVQESFASSSCKETDKIVSLRGKVVLDSPKQVQVRHKHDFYHVGFPSTAG